MRDEDNDGGNEGSDRRVPRNNRRLPETDAKTSLVDRIKTTVPAMFSGQSADDLPEQVQLLLDMRAHRLRRFLIRAGVFILLPSLLVLFYTSVIATPRYVCTFEETYQVYQPTASLAGAVTPSVATTSDTIDYGSVIVQYITSAAMAAKLESQLNLRAHFSDKKIDWTSRMSKNATNAQYLAYYNKRVSVSEGFGGYLTINVEAFDPQFAVLLAQTINTDADQMLNDMTVAARTAGVRDANSQLSTASLALNKANDALTEFRNGHGDLDPTLIATEIATIEGTLDSQLASLRAQLVQAQANMQSNAPQIVQLNLQISAVEQQRAAERQRLADSGGKASYSNTVADYDNLLADQQLATTTYQAAQQGVVIAMANATAKQNYVVDFVPPVLPDQPTAPNPAKSTGMAFLACMLLYGILNLLFTALRDQTGI